MRFKGRLLARREKFGYIFVFPYIIGIMFFFIVPIVESFAISLGDINSKNGYDIVVKGLENYYHAFRGDAEFLPLLLSSVGSMAATVPIIIIVSFIVASLLNRKMPGRILFRCIFFLPVIISTGIMKTIELDHVLASVIIAGETNVVTGEVLSSSQRYITELMLSSNLSPEISNYIMFGISNILNVLNDSGIQILIFLAALQTISPSLYEASAIEGATGWENFWKITLPMISPQILVVTVYTIIDSFVDTNNDIMRYMYTKSFTDFEFGYSAAMSWIYFIIIFIFIALVFLLSRPIVFYQGK